MNRVRFGGVLAVIVCLSLPIFGASYTSAQSGDWSAPATWGGSVPISGDTVTITSNHVVTVTDAQTIASVTLDSTSGNKMLVIDGTGTLTIDGLANALVLNAPAPGSTNIVRINGGGLSVQNGDLSITGGASSASKLEFTSLGGNVDIAGNLLFAGTAANAVVDYGTGGAPGTILLGGDLGNGGTITTTTNSVFELDGSGAQTINSYTFQNFNLNKPSGTATLNGFITVNGDLDISSGLLDDGGYQINLNGGGTSSIYMGGSGVLKLGSAASATSFPTPYSSISLNPSSAIVYHSGIAQTVNAAVPYERLYLATLGGSVTHTVSGPLSVNQQLDITDNGSNTVTLSLGNNNLDVGDISGDGDITAATNQINVSGNWGSSVTLSPGASVVVYDGISVQNVAPTTYYKLSIAKASGTATLGGSTTVNDDLAIMSGTLATGGNALSIGDQFTINGTFDPGNAIVTMSGDLSSTGTILTSNATFKFNGTSTQLISSASNVTVGTLEDNNANFVTLDGSAVYTINSALNLYGGVLIANGAAGKFVVDVLATVNRTTGWVAGYLTMGMNPAPARRFHVGTATPPAYLPVDVDAGSAGLFTITAQNGQHPDRTGDNILERYWSVAAPTTVSTVDSLSFFYNASDVVTGSETQYILASYNPGTLTFTHYSPVNVVTHNGIAGTPVSFIEDWVVGQPGSLAAASKLAMTSINSGSNPTANVPFDVLVTAVDDSGFATEVFDDTTVTLSETAGTGTLGGTLVGVITSGNNNVLISGVTYNQAETGLLMSATASGGDALASCTTSWAVDAAPSTITVTNLNDSGPGSLRAAITDANSGACTSPCTIGFSVAGTINLSSALPVIAASNLTIDGYTAPGAQANTNAFGVASDAVIVLSLNGGGSIANGFDIQETFVKISGFAIGGFTGAGVKFTGDNSGSMVTGCHIGVDTSGTTINANAYGVVFDASTEASIGGALPAQRNIISGNTFDGIHTTNAANTISITGNYVGTNKALTAALPNNTGVMACSGCSVTIGQSGTGNVISGNSGTGLALFGNGVDVKANIIGVAGNGTTAIPNADGITIVAGATLNTIGGSSPSDINTIAGNTQNGILIDGSGNTIENNRIGLATDGTTALANGGSGIKLQGTASNNTIGQASGNTIANNTGDGVTLIGTGIGNAIRRNSIKANGNLGIDLGDDGVTSNDATDSDTGPNNKQNFPTINSAQYSAGTLTLTTSINSSSAVSAGAMIFDVYKADASATPQGYVHLGASNCLGGNVFANASFNITSAATVGDKIVMTATVYSDGACTTVSEGTSEFSPAATISGDIHWIAGTGNWETAANWSPAVVPTAADNAIIDASGAYTVTINSAAIARSITVGTGTSGTQTLSLAPGSTSLTISDPSSVTTTGVLIHSGLTLTGNGGLDVYGTFEWNGGTISGAAGWNIKTGATLNINTAAGKALSQRLLTIDSGGTTNWLGGAISLGSGAGIDNFGLFEAKTDATFSDSGSDAGFDNFGTFRKSTTAGSTSFSSVDFNHTSGTLDIQTGTFNPGGGTSTAAISISSGAEFLMDSDTYIFGSGSNATGLGKVHVTAGTLTLNGNITIDHLQFDGGIVDGTGLVAIGATGQWFWTGGTMSGSGTTQVPTGASLTVSGTSAKSLTTRTISIQVGGQMNLGGSGTLNLSSGGNIFNNGTLDNLSDLNISDAGSDGGINNTGLFKKSAGAGSTNLVNVSMTNAGTIQVQSGTLNPSILGSTGAIVLTGNLVIDSDTVTLSGASDVSGTGLLQVAGGTLTLDNVDTIANFELTSGTLDGTGTLNVGTASWSGGTMSGLGITNVPGSATLTISGPTAKSLQRTLNIAIGGTVSITGGGTINLSTGSSISNAGLIDITVGVIFNDAGSAGDITNSGTFNVNSAGPVQLTGVTLGGSGTIALGTSSFLSVADGTQAGPITLGTSAVFSIPSSTYTFANGTSISGTGTVNIAGGQLDVTATSLNIPILNLSVGTLGGTGIVNITGNSGWLGGTMSGSGTTNVVSGGLLNIQGSGGKAIATRTLSTSGAGTIQVSGTGTINVSSGASINNAGTLQINADNIFNNGGAAGAITNTGTITKSAATGTTFFTGVPLVNNGGTIEILDGIINAGGGFSQSSGTFRVRLNGTVPGAQHGQLIASGTPSLAGTLDVTLNGPYQPIGGDLFRVLNATAHTGDFSVYNLPPLANSRTWGSMYDATGLVLKVNGTTDLSIAKSAPFNNVATGGAIPYSLVVTNNGPDSADGVVVTDTLPAGHTGISANGTGWTCNVVSLTVTCNANAALSLGTAPTITINSTAPTTPQTFTNTASVSTITNDSNNTNDSANWMITVDANQADINLTATGPGSSVPTGNNFQFDFLIKNLGPQTATSVTFSAPIPPALTYNSAAPDAGSCNFSANTVTCNVGNLVNGGQVHVIVDLTGNTTGTHTVTATASATEGDPIPSSNSTAASVTIAGSSLIVTNTNDSGPGSLRQALLDTSTACNTLPCTIAFNIGAGPFVITPASALPAVSTQILVDATTQPGYAGTPIVRLSGQGLQLSGTGAAVKGLSITNATYAIDISGNSNTIESNYLGLDLSGNVAANTTGVRVTGSSNTIGGTTAAQRNIISGNTDSGVILTTSANNNVVAGNYIGTDPSGSSARPNDRGVQILDGSDNNTIGGATTAHRNLISGNTTYGIYIEGSAPAASPDNNSIQNNWIGLDVSGTTILSNASANVKLINYALGNHVGTNGAGNVIAGSNFGVIVNADGNYVYGNTIGLASDGVTPAANTTGGIFINAANTFVGSMTAGEENVIASNGGYGIGVGGGNANSFLGNSLHDNGGIGIDLNTDGVTPNDAGDADTGPNGYQNAPVITDVAILGGGDIRIAYNIDSSSAPSGVGSVMFEFFKADASGEGKTHLLFNCIAGNNLGIGTSFSAPSVVAGDSIVATATTYTDSSCITLADGTSEFSAPFIAANCTPPAVTITGPTTYCAGAANITLDAGAGFDTYLWSNGATTRTISVAPGTTTNYSVTVTNAIGCPNTATHNVSVITTPTPTITGPTATCASSPVTLDAGAGYVSYAWSTGATTQTITVSPSSTTTYTVTVSNGGSCNASDSHIVNVTANPVASVNTPASVCANGTASASVAPIAGATYVWSMSNGTITGGAGTNAITFTAGASGNVTLSVNITSGSCASNSGVINIPITSAASATIIGPTTVCARTPFVLDAGAGYTSYLWNTGETTQTINRVLNSGSQTYSVTVTTAGGCIVSTSHNVSVSSDPKANITATNSAAPNTTLNASMLSQPGATYSWSITNGTILSGNGTNAITFKTGASGTTRLNSSVTIGTCVDNDVHNVSITTSTLDADLAITKTAPATVNANSSLTYMIGVTNNGPATANGVVIEDTLPPGVTVTNIASGPWSCAQLTGAVRCTGTAFANTSSNIQITVTAPAASGAITNVVTISASTPDPILSNNTASVTTSITTPSCETTGLALISPADGATVDSLVTLDWTDVFYATGYDVWLVTNNGPTLAGTSTRSSFTIVASSGTTSWFVVAKFPTCDPLTSVTRTFVVQENGDCASHTAPHFTAPLGSTINSPVTFAWTPVPQAIGYRVWVEAGGTAAQDVGTTDGALTLTAAVPAGAINAYVEALFHACPPTRSPSVAFEVRQPDPCANRTVASPVSPSNNSTLNASSVEFVWNAANDADGYRVWISIDGAAPEVLGTTTDETSLRATLERGSAIWWVETLYDGCASTESTRSSFTIPAAQTCNPSERAQLIAPSNNANVNGGSITFQWTPVSNAIAYEVWLSVGNGTPALLGSTTSTSFTANVPAGKLEWFVRAYVDRCPSRDSLKSRFTFAEPNACANNVRVKTLAPLDGVQSTSPVTFAWTASVGATRYELYTQRGGNTPQLLASTTSTHVNNIVLNTGKLRWFVRTRFGDSCSPLDSEVKRLEVIEAPVACAPISAPIISTPGQISSGIPFLVQWAPVAGANAYQLQIASTADFANAQNITTNTTSYELVRTNNGTTPLSIFVRARAFDGRCAPTTISAYSAPAAIFILPSAATEGSTTVNGGVLLFTLPLGPELAGQTFIAMAKHPWLSVTPASGVVPASGINLTVRADANDLPIGTSLGGITVTLTTPSANNVSTNGTTVFNPGFSVSLVTPVTPTTKSAPPPDALIIPAVAHADGINSHFQSDVRVSNTSPSLMTYELTFTPSGDSGITEGKQTQFSVEPGQTIALDDILRSWFGTGGVSVTGSLEIRPVTQSSARTTSEVLAGLSNLVTFASSRTFNLTSNGTFGQYIPAVPFASFIGKAAEVSQRNVLSLQQLAQSERYRTNLGIVEGSGEPVSLLVKIFGDNGAKLGEFPLDLKGGEHRQLNSFLVQNGVSSLTDGRIELEVTSDVGKVTAYASVLDNQTADPLLVTPVTLTEAGNTKWVVPGIADLNNGIANWQSDMRVFNAGTTDVDATLTYYSQNGGEPKVSTLTIPAGQVRQFDRTLATVFGVSNDGGAVHISTANASRLIATARTYNQTTSGTYGQFISAVTPNEAAGTDTRPLQLLQVEETTRFRSNIGLAEVTGNPATIEIAVVPPDSKFTVTTQLTLAPNEFRQLGSLLKSVGLADTHNARVTVSVIDGTGRVAAYASVIDLETNDPTYVPAQ